MSTHTKTPRRGKTLTGLTAKERERQIHKLDGSSAFSPKSNKEGIPVCKKCQQRKEFIASMEKEFHNLRQVLLNKSRVPDLSENDQLFDKDARKSSSSVQLALIQESAKLRITIDTLMRFQVCTHLQMQYTSVSYSPLIRIPYDNCFQFSFSMKKVR